MKTENISIGNAAGTIKTMREVERACNSKAMTAITVGSVTVKPRKGNAPDPGHGRIYYFDEHGGWSVNALGMPNIGIVAYLTQFEEMVRRAHAAGKELRVSIAGGKPEEYADMTEQCYACGVDTVELNLGCPNVWGPEGVQKPIPSYHPDLTKRILLTVRSILKGKKVDVKISPVKDELKLRMLAEIFRDSRCVGNVVGTNTIPNQERFADDFHPALSFNEGNHQGGLAGSALYSDSLWVHKKMREHLPREIGYIAVGGITNGGAMFKHLSYGAVGIQSGTGYYQEGPRVFTLILEQFAELVELKTA